MIQNNHVDIHLKVCKKNLHPNFLLKKRRNPTIFNSNKKCWGKSFFLSDGETNTGGRRVGEVVKLKLEAEFDYLRVTRKKKQ